MRARKRSYYRRFQLEANLFCFYRNTNSPPVYVHQYTKQHIQRKK